jgi:hypothetical protein
LIYVLGGGRKIREPEKDKKLLNWFYNYHYIEGNKVSSKEFKIKALSFSNDPSFCASKGWLQKFKKRYNIQFD